GHRRGSRNWGLGHADRGHGDQDEPPDREDRAPHRRASVPWTGNGNGRHAKRTGRAHAMRTWGGRIWNTGRKPCVASRWSGRRRGRGVRLGGLVLRRLGRGLLAGLEDVLHLHPDERLGVSAETAI